MIRLLDRLAITVGFIAALSVADIARGACEDTGSGQSVSYTTLNRAGEMGHSPSAGSCSGCDSNGVTTWTVNVSCNSGNCTCGYYLDGSPWVLDPNCDSETTANSVVFVSETPSARSGSGAGSGFAINGIMKNPTDMGGLDGTSDEQGWSNKIPTGTFPPDYNATLNIGAGGLSNYEANATTAAGAASFVKQFTFEPGSATCAADDPVPPDPPQCGGSNSSCAYAYAVVTVVCTAPAANSFRPPYAFTTKPAASYGATPAWRDASVRYDLVPTYDMLSRTSPPSFSRAYRQIAMPQVDVIHAQGGSNQWGVGLLNSSAPGNCPAYGRGIGAERGRSLFMMMDDCELDTPGSSCGSSGSNTRRQLIRAWVQAGIDYYGLVAGVNPATHSGIWKPSGGHGIGRKVPLVVAALLLDDASMRQRIRDIVARTDGSLGDWNKMFNEDALAYWSTTAQGGARALYGELCENHLEGSANENCTRWWTLAANNNQYCRDPNGYVDGGTQSQAIGAYLYNITTPCAHALALALFPALREIWAHDPFLQLCDRMYGYESDVGNGGWWADDNCANSPEPACSGGSDNLCTEPPGAMPRRCGTNTCESQHLAGGVPWGDANTTAMMEDVYADLRICDDDPNQPGCSGYKPLRCGDTIAGTSWCVGAECPDVDFDNDGIDDCEDSCPTIDDDGVDTDGDGVDSACDTCLNQANPQQSSLPDPNRTYVSGQRDDDADGRGNRCDFDYNNLGAVVNTTDFNDMKASVGNLMTASNCGALAPGGSGNTQRCGEFDHDGLGAVVSPTDFNLCKSAVGQVINTVFPKCSACSEGTGWSNVLGPGARLGRPVCQMGVGGACNYAP